jgi:hypothetical protein
LLIQNGEISDPNYAYDEKGKLRRVRTTLIPKKSGGQPLSRYEQWAKENPIPGAMDSLTGEKMQVPTISPDGYVLDYNSWIKTISHEATNPFTKHPVKKRDLVVLTRENWDLYKDQIKNLVFE